MTLDEAQMIAKIVGTADGGCPTCVSMLVEHLNREFPQFVFVMGDQAPPMGDDDFEDPWYGSRYDVHVSSKATDGQE